MLPNLSILSKLSLNDGTAMANPSDKRQRVAEEEAKEEDEIISRTHDEIFITSLDLRFAWKGGQVLYARNKNFGYIDNSKVRGVMAQLAFNALEIGRTSSPDRGSFNHFQTYSSELEALGIFKSIDKATFKELFSDELLSGNVRWGIRVNRGAIDIDQAAHEAFLTCYAAYQDVGPITYACTLVQRVDRTYVAIYVIEAGIPGDVVNTKITKSNYTIEELQVMGQQLLELFLAFDTLHLLMTDNKPENMIWVKRRSYFEPKFIDFDSKYTIMLYDRLHNIDSSCLIYLNGLLFLSHIACKSFEYNANNLELALLYEPLMNEILNMSSVMKTGKFCHRLYNLSLKETMNVTMLDPWKTTLKTVGDLVIRRLQHYCENSSKLVKPWPNTFQPANEIGKLLHELHDRMKAIKVKHEKEEEEELVADSSSSGF